MTSKPTTPRDSYASTPLASGLLSLAVFGAGVHRDRRRVIWVKGPLRVREGAKTLHLPGVQWWLDAEPSEIGRAVNHGDPLCDVSACNHVQGEAAFRHPQATRRKRPVDDPDGSWTRMPSGVGTAPGDSRTTVALTGTVTSMS